SISSTPTPALPSRSVGPSPNARLTWPPVPCKPPRQAFRNRPASLLPSSAFSACVNPFAPEYPSVSILQKERTESCGALKIGHLAPSPGLDKKRLSLYYLVRLRPIRMVNLVRELRIKLLNDWEVSY